MCPKWCLQECAYLREMAQGRAPMKKRKKSEPMPDQVWVCRVPGAMEFLTWDLDPAMPKGEAPATRYIRADLVESMRDDMVRWLRETAPQKPTNGATPDRTVLGGWDVKP